MYIQMLGDRRRSYRYGADAIGGTGHTCQLQAYVYSAYISDHCRLPTWPTSFVIP